MITNTTDRTLIKSPPKDTAEYFVDPSNMAQVGLILQGMYSDPVLAIEREYTANAVDAHAQVGKHNVPVIVRLPNAFSPRFEVEDEGPGLSVPDSRRLLLGYGASGDHKRTSNDYIGGFGIGCKCALSMVDQFTYTIWHGGMKRIWNSYKDEHGLSKADLVFEAPSERGNHTGVKVTVPVPEASHHQFHARIQDALKYFTVLPKVEGLLDNKVINTFKPLAGVSVNTAYGATIMFGPFQHDAREPVLVMGGVGYPVDLSKVFDGTMPTDTRMLVEKMVIYAPIGTVQLAPSREALQYTAFTRRRLQEITEPFSPTKLEATLLDILSQQKTTVAKVDTWSKLYVGSYSRTYATICDRIEKDKPWLSRHGLGMNTGKLKAMAVSGLSYIGWEYANDSVYTQYDLQGARNPGYRNCLSMLGLGQSMETTYGWDKTIAVSADSLRILFLSKTDKVPEARNLAYTVWKNEGFEAGTRRNLIVLALAEESKKDLFKLYPWVKELIDTDPTVVADKNTWLLEAPADTPITKAQWAALERNRAAATNPASVTRTTPQRTKVAAHSVKLLKLKSGALHVSRNSDNWTPATINSKKLAGEPYVLMDKFEVTPHCMFGSMSHARTELVRNLLNNNEALSGKDVYGLRLRDKDKTYDMKPLDEYLLDWLTQRWATLNETEKHMARAFGSVSIHYRLFERKHKFAQQEVISAIAAGMTDASKTDLAKLVAEAKSAFGEYRSQHENLFTALDATLSKWGAYSKAPGREYHEAYLELEEYFYAERRSLGKQMKLGAIAKKLVPLIQIIRTFDLVATDDDTTARTDKTKADKAIALIGKAAPDKDMFAWYTDLIQAMGKEKTELLDIVLVQTDVTAIRNLGLARISDRLLKSVTVSKAD